MKTPPENLIEQCVDILYENDLVCILTSVEETGCPVASIVKPLCGLGLDTIYFILDKDAVHIKNFTSQPKGSITYCSKGNSVHLTGYTIVISAKTRCQDITDTHLFSRNVPGGCVLLKFVTHKAHVQIDHEKYDVQI